MFARCQSPVASSAKHIAKGNTIFGEMDRPLIHPALLSIETAKQASPRWHTFSCVVELCETKTVLRQEIKIRRCYFAAIASDIGPPHIICKNKDNVRPIVLGPLDITVAATQDRKSTDRQRTVF